MELDSNKLKNANSSSSCFIRRHFITHKHNLYTCPGRLCNNCIGMFDAANLIKILKLKTD